MSHQAEAAENHAGFVQSAMDLAGVGCWEFDLKTRTVVANKIMASLFGLPEYVAFTPTRTQEWIDAITREDRDRVIAQCMRAWAGAGDQIEVQFRLAKAPASNVLVRGSASEWKDGRVICARGIAIRTLPSVVRLSPEPEFTADADGTAEALARRDQLLIELGRDRELLHALFESIPVMLTIYDPKLLDVNVNREFTRVLGWTPEDAVRMDLFTACYPDPREAECAAAFMRSLAPGWQDFKVMAKNGEYVETSWANVGLSDNRTVGIGIDMRERRAAQRNLKESAEQLAFAVESMELGTFDADIGGGKLSLSPRAKELMGVPPEGEISFDNWQDFFPAEDAAQIRTAVYHALESETRKFMLEHRIIPQSGGEERWLCTYGRVISGDDGKLVRLTGVHLDITTRKRNEAALAQARERQEMLTHVVSRLLSAENPQGIIDDLAKHVMRKTGAEVYFNYLVDQKPAEDAEPRLRLNSFASILPAPISRGEHLEHGNSVCGRVAYEGALRVYTGIQESTDALTAMLRGEGVRTYWCYPLTGSSGVLGTLGFGSRSQDQFSPEDLNVMQTVADHIAIAIERMLDRKAIVASEARYKAIARNIPDGAILVADPDMQVTTVEGPLAEKLNSRHLVGRVLNPDEGTLEAGISPAQIRKALAGETTFGSAEQGGRHLEVSYLPLLNEGGKVLGAMALVFDITQRKHAEDAMRESERQERARAAELEAVMEAVPAATFVTRDPEGRSAYANPVGYEALRLPPGDEKSLHDLDLSTPGKNAWKSLRVLEQGRELEPQFHPLQVAARTGQAVRDRELEFVYADGTSRYLFGSAVPLLSSEGHPNGAVAAFIDLTDRKKVEAQFLQAQKLESVGVLAGGVAHDFNNLLTGILGNASLAQLEAPPRVVEKLNRIIQSADKASGLTRQLLAYAGKGQFMVTDVDLAHVIHSSTDLILFSITKNIELDVTGVTIGLPSVRADVTQVQQIIMNLVINAAEAIGPSHSGKITISTGSLDTRPGSEKIPDLAPGKYVYVRVRDNGCGMDARTKARIFDPFFTTKFTGRGLGLAAVQGAVRTLKGLVDVESYPDQGSSFTIYLPVFERKAPSPTRPASTRVMAAKRTSILIVDDEQVIRDIARLTLERFGHKVFVTSNGREALETLAKESDIELVVLDVVMPVMGGMDTLIEIRSRWPHLTVLLTSGFNREETTRLGHLPYDTPFIQKPYTIQQLAHAVNEALDEGAILQ